MGFKKKETKVTLEYILKYKNVNGKPYMCDIKKWMKTGNSEEIQKLLSKLRRIYEQRP